jgi:hypothetical protein
MKAGIEPDITVMWWPNDSEYQRMQRAITVLEVFATKMKITP